MRTALIFTLLLSSASAAPALAGEKTQSAANDRKKIICVKEPEVGTRFSRRVCKTAEQWEQDRLDAKDMLERSHRLQNNPQG
jgi:hypothetical protein